MPDPLAIFERLGSAYLKYARDDALAPFGRFAWMFLAATLLALWRGPNWLLVMLAVLDCLLAISFIISYFYLLFNDRDALRSEHYNVQKMALERGLLGDSGRGLGTVETPPGPAMLPLNEEERDA